MKEKLIEFLFDSFKSFLIGFVIGGIIGILILNYIIQTK